MHDQIDLVRLRPTAETHDVDLARCHLWIPPDDQLQVLPGGTNRRPTA